MAAFRKIKRYEILSGDGGKLRWVRVKSGTPLANGFFKYETYEGSVSIKRPKFWRECD